MLSSSNRPTAIFAASDLLARVVYRVAAEMDLQITRDLTVVGFSDDEFASELSPPLTTIRQNPYAAGRRAAEIVIERASGADGQRPIHATIPIELIERSSTAAPASARS